MKTKALACGDTLPDLSGISTSGSNSGTNTGTGGNTNTGISTGTNSGQISCNRPQINSCLKTANESIFTESNPGEKCR